MHAAATAAAAARAAAAVSCTILRLSRKEELQKRKGDHLGVQIRV